MNGDPFDNSTPKYSSATDIYDAVQEMSRGEEIGILAEMFADVSWEGQDYYYVDNGGKLVDRWERITDYGDKMWLMDVAAWQVAGGDANGMIYEALYNDDLAKRIGFKKIFIDTVLSGATSQYKDAAEAYEEELHEQNRFDYYANTKALAAALPSLSWDDVRYRYNKLCSAVYGKLKGLRLDDEKQLIIESRAMLTGYDDFMFGLRANQEMFQAQEKMYQNKVALLQEKYEDAMRMLLSMAQEQGVVLRLPDEPLLIEAPEAAS